MKKKVGLIVNPIAGIGGRAGLKGSDGLSIQGLARKRGSRSFSFDRTIQALRELIGIKNEIEVITYPSIMGEKQLRELGFTPKVIGPEVTGGNCTSPLDTINAAKEMLKLSCDLIIFVGGDGTARDIYQAVGNKIPTIGVPAGVKIHSAVYANNPRSAGELARLFLEDKIENVKECEVLDINESLLQKGRVNVSLFGYLKVPCDTKLIQNVKSGGYSSDVELNGIATDIVEKMEDDVYYVVGPGTTTRSIMDLLNLSHTLLGVDVVYNKKLIARDVSEETLWQIINGKETKIILTVIGGQGHILGRGNQQITPRIIENVGKQNLLIIATTEKLLSVPSYRLLVDTGSEYLDNFLKGYIKVTTNYNEFTLVYVDS